MSGLELPVIGANAAVGCAPLVALAWSGAASVNVPLTRRPVAAASGSDTLSVASPPVLVTVAATEVR